MFILKIGNLKKFDNLFNLNEILLMEVIWIKEMGWLMVEIKWDV